MNSGSYEMKYLHMPTCSHHQHGPIWKGFGFSKNQFYKLILIILRNSCFWIFRLTSKYALILQRDVLLAVLSLERSMSQRFI